MLACGALAGAVGAQFEPYLGHFMPVLQGGLERHEEQTVCGICIATVGDLCRSLERKILPYCDAILQVQYTLVKDPNVSRKLKPGIMQCFGDIALATEKDFVKYLQPVIEVLQQASAAQVGPDATPEWEEYIAELQESVLEAYTGILHGLKAEDSLGTFKVHVNAVLDFVQRLTQEKPPQEVVKAMVGVLGDLVFVFKAEIATYLLAAPFMVQLVNLAKGCNDPTILRDAQWLESLMMKFKA